MGVPQALNIELLHEPAVPLWVHTQRRWKQGLREIFAPPRSGHRYPQELKCGSSLDEQDAFYRSIRWNFIQPEKEGNSGRCFNMEEA